MRDDELRRILVAANPWWRAGAGRTSRTVWANDHPLLRDRERYDVGYRARVLDDLGSDPLGDALVVLTGPRRVGKSVALLDLVLTLCQRDDVDPRQLIHLPCDGLTDRDLRRALVQGRALTAVLDREGPRPRVWLLDEVSGIAGWTAAVKYARDQTDVRRDTVILSGSRWSPTEDVEGQLLAGRAGTTAHRRVRHLHPMTFRDVLAATHPTLPLPPSVHPATLQEMSLRPSLEELRLWIDDFDLAWQDYLSVGGFPRAVAEWLRTGTVSDAYLRDLTGWLRADVDPDGRPDSLPILLSTLENRLSSPLNVRGTAQTLGLPRHTFEQRLDRLVRSFAALWVPQRDDAGFVVSGAQAKLYLSDPLLAWMPSRLRAGVPQPDMTRLSEAAIGVALARAIDALEAERWVRSDTIGYARTQSHGEVDLAPVPVPTAANICMTVPLESKWVEDGWRSEARTIEGKYGAGIMATKSVLDLEHRAWAVPAPMVALLLE